MQLLWQRRTVSIFSLSVLFPSLSLISNHFSSFHSDSSVLLSRILISIFDSTNSLFIRCFCWILFYLFFLLFYFSLLWLSIFPPFFLSVLCLLFSLFLSFIFSLFLSRSLFLFCRLQECYIAVVCFCLFILPRFGWRQCYCTACCLACSSFLSDL